MRKVFLDVGSHEGQTLQEVVKDEWAFDVIHAFEPMAAQFDRLVDRYAGDPRIRFWPFGLADFSGPSVLYGDNANMGASIHPAKRDVDAAQVTACEMRSASEFVSAHVHAADWNVAKMNCEGAETAILRDLTESGMIWRIDRLMIDFDIRKVPGRESEETDVLRGLDDIHFHRHSLAEDVMVGATHQERIANWLRGAE